MLLIVLSVGVASIRLKPFAKHFLQNWWHVPPKLLELIPFLTISDFMFRHFSILDFAGINHVVNFTRRF